MSDINTTASIDPNAVAPAPVDPAPVPVEAPAPAADPVVESPPVAPPTDAVNAALAEPNMLFVDSISLRLGLYLQSFNESSRSVAGFAAWLTA